MNYRKGIRMSAAMVHDKLGLGIDLGTANLLVFLEKKGIIFNEPAVIAFDRESGKIVAAGEDAHRMLGKVHSKIAVIKPLKNGVISDMRAAKALLTYVLGKIENLTEKDLSKTTCVICCPSEVTKIERDVMADLAAKMKITDVFIEEEIKSGALGAGVDIFKSKGVMVVDIGGGTIKISIFHNDSLRYIDTISIGGENITQDLSIGLRTPRAEAEKIKIEHGSCAKDMIDFTKSITIPGVNARDNREISIEKIVDIVEPRVAEMMELIRESIIRSTYMSKLNTGIVFTGGSSNIRGLQRIAEQQLELPAKIGHPKKLQGLSDHINNPIYAVAVGMVMYISQERNRPRHVESKRGMGVSKTVKKLTDSFKEMFKL